jgi:glycosyltransferase involved in cell wall biosynthesis
VGDGPERGRLLQLAEQLGIRAHVRFWGFRGKIQQILACCDLFVNSSTTEGISVSILEAMSMGLPVVATAVGGTPSIVKSGGNGLLVAPGRPDQMANAMLWLLQDCELRYRMGDRGLEQVKERWSLERMAARYLELYQQVLAARVRSRAEVA